MSETKRPLKVFLCHASADKPKVRELYRTLKRRGVQPWLDAENLIPGQNWEVEIPKALLSSDAIIICLSPNSIDKEGYVQKEIKFALDKALEMPEGRIFIIPAKLEECDLPFGLRQYQAVNLYEKVGYVKLMKALKLRASQLERNTVELPKEGEIAPELKKVVEEKKSVETEEEKPITKTFEPSYQPSSQDVNVGSSINNVGKQEISEPVKPAEKRIETPKPKVEKPKPKKIKSSRKLNTAIIVALIGLVGTIIAALLGSPVIEKWFSPAPITTATSPSLASTATLLFFTPTLNIPVATSYTLDLLQKSN
jgi:TIR domain-containing protein